MSEVAMSFGMSQRAVNLWLARHRDAGVAGLQDRSSATRRDPNALAPAQLALARLLRHAKLVAAKLVTWKVENS